MSQSNHTPPQVLLVRIFRKITPCLKCHYFNHQIMWKHMKLSKSAVRMPLASPAPGNWYLATGI